MQQLRAVKTANHKWQMDNKMLMPRVRTNFIIMELYITRPQMELQENESFKGYYEENCKICF